MGKATIYEHLGGSKYSILYTPEVTDLTARIDALEVLKTQLDEQLYATNGLVMGRDAAQIEYNAATANFNAALDDWAYCATQLPPCEDQAALMAVVVELGTVRAEAGAALTVMESEIAKNRADYFATTQEIAYLQNTQKGSGAGLMEAWCIDYDSAVVIPTSTVVGTIETYGAKGGYDGGYLPRKWVNIQSSSTPAYSAARDHCIKPVSGIKTAALFYNYCQWLYVMSRNPQYAVGVVQSKFDEHQTYLDIELFGTTPGASQPAGWPYDGGYSVMLLNVPVLYLTCGAEAFIAGDLAVVRFGGVGRADPLVIGFAESPKLCPPMGCFTDWPYHGLVKNGHLALPNGTSRLVDQPYTNGDVITLRIPDHTAPARSEAEEEADLAAGRTWHDYKTISGSNRAYNETCELGTDNHWVWAESSTTHWHAMLDASASLDTVAGVTTISFDVELFDPNILTDSEGATTTHTISISQVLTGTWTDSFDSATVGSALKVIDVSSDGAKVLMTAKRRSQGYRDGQRGFFLLQITSTSTATLTVLADHEDCNPSWPHIYHPDDGTYYQFGYADIPVWAWFDSSDAVKFVHFFMDEYGSSSSNITSIKLKIDGVEKSVFSNVDNSASFDGVTPWGIVRLDLNGWTESGDDSLYSSEVQFNAKRWDSYCQSYFTDLLPGEVSDGDAVMRIDTIVYSNKSVGLRVQMYHIFVDGAGFSYSLGETYYGNILHPTGPTDPGTWISNDGAPPFVLTTQSDVAVVHAIPDAKYGSYNLKTGQLSRNQTVPVCYV